MLNPDSPIPLYRQLADILSENIRTGFYAAGDRIPSEHQLAEQYGIGRPTARQATDMLVRKRLLIRKRGAGTFVREAPQEVNLFSLAGTISSFRKKGIDLTTRILKKTSLISIDGQPENPFEGRKAYFLSRLSRAEKMPVLLEDMYFQPELFHDLDRFLAAGRSLSRLVEEHYYMRPIGGTQNFRIVGTSPERAMHLRIPEGSPILLVKRFLHFRQARNAVYAELYCRTDQYVFSQEIGGPDHDT